LILACNNSQNNHKKLLAQYNNKQLYYTDIYNIIPKGLSPKDSLKYLNKIKNEWLFQQIIIEKAEKILPSSDLNIHYLVEKYKADLLKWKYEDYYLKKNLPKNISEQELMEYYQKNKTAFLAKEDIAKIIFVKIKKNTPRRYLLKQWFGNKNKEEKLQEYCSKYAIECNDFEKQWVSLKKILENAHLPNSSNPVKKHEIIEHKNQFFYYYIYIEDLIKKNEIAPYSYVKDDITQNILYLKKAELIQNLEQNIKEEIKKINKTNL